MLVALYVGVFLASAPIWLRYYQQYFDAQKDWTLACVHEVSKAIDQYAEPGETIISTWSGYPAISHARQFAGMENDSRLASAELLSDHELLTYRLLNQRQSESAIRRHQVRIVVFAHRRSPPGTVPEEGYAALLPVSGYMKVRSVGATDVYVCAE